MGSMAQFSKRVKTNAESRADRYTRKFGLAIWKKRKLNWQMLDYLDGCKDDSARRVLLGIGRPR